MRFDWSKRIADYFDAAAPAYARSIDPVFSQLAHSLVEAAHVNAADIVIDLGTGTGLVARAASQFTSQVIGIDFSPVMLRIARQRVNSSLIRGDLHSLPIASHCVDIALASFAFNSTDPAAAFAEAHRVLRTGGRLVLQEWAEADEVSDLVSDLFAEYMVDDPPADLDVLRNHMQQPIPWDDLESIEDLQQSLVDAGFGAVEVRYLTPQIVLPDAETFLRYKLAWPIRAAELAAMPHEVRALCLNDLRENIAPYIQRHTGEFIWRPNIVRISAAR